MSPKPSNIAAGRGALSYDPGTRTGENGARIQSASQQTAVTDWPGEPSGWLWGSLWLPSFQCRRRRPSSLALPGSSCSFPCAARRYKRLRAPSVRRSRPATERPSISTWSTSTCPTRRSLATPGSSPISCSRSTRASASTSWSRSAPRRFNSSFSTGRPCFRALPWSSSTSPEAWSRGSSCRRMPPGTSRCSRARGRSAWLSTSTLRPAAWCSSAAPRPSTAPSRGSS